MARTPAGDSRWVGGDVSETANKPGLPFRQIFAITAGNALSFYDFVCYAFFATQIGASFFPSADRTTSLLASLATFGAGFFTRPLGALIIGRALRDPHELAAAIGTARQP